MINVCSIKKKYFQVFKWLRFEVEISVEVNSDYMIVDLTPEEKKLLENIQERKARLLQEIQVRDRHSNSFSLNYSGLILYSFCTKQQNFGHDEIVSICRLQIKHPNMTTFLFDKIRKHCRKRRKCWWPAFSPFPTVFSKAFFRVVVCIESYIQNFIFQLREYPCNITHDILFLIYNGYF